MTIAIGMLARDGVVIAADTQMGVTDWLKTGQGKIAFATSGSVNDPQNKQAFAVTGAGDGGYLDALRTKMIGCFTKDYSTGPLTHIENNIQDELTEFHEAHVERFSQWNDRPDFWLLMGAQRGSQRLLWTTKKNLVIPHYQHAAVGAGEMYAKILMNRIYSEMDSDATALLAAYVIFQVKESVDGCGRETDIVTLRTKGPSFTDRDEIRALEEVFREYARFEGSILTQTLRSVFAEQIDGKPVIDGIHRFREDIRTIFQRRVKPQDPQSTKADPSRPQPLQELPED
jgi:hypothetical protein